MHRRKKKKQGAHDGREPSYISLPSRGIISLEVDVERADLCEPGGDADRRDAVELGGQLAVLPEPGDDLVFRAGSDLGATKGLGIRANKGGKKTSVKTIEKCVDKESEMHTYAMGQTLNQIGTGQGFGWKLERANKEEHTTSTREPCP